MYLIMILSNKIVLNGEMVVGIMDYVHQILYACCSAV